MKLIEKLNKQAFIKLNCVTGTKEKAMQYYTPWAGAYEFKSELKEILQSWKKQIEFIINKINETDKKIGG